MRNEQLIADLISLLTNRRKERYRYEKHIALMTFAAWLFYPNDRAVLRHAQIMASAACYLESGKPNPLATIENLSLALLDSPLDGSLIDLPASSVTLAAEVGHFISFFMCCPPEMKPSLNKAFYFIESGGYDDDAPSNSTLKVAWRERASTAPFWWASTFTVPDVWEFFPEDLGTFKRVDRLLAKPDKLLDFFGMARFIQERLVPMLDPASRRRLNVKFPKGLKPLECEFEPFDDRQLKILGGYRAPTPMY